MHATGDPSSGPLILACSGPSYLGRLTVSAARELWSLDQARLLTVGALPDFEAIRQALDGCDRWIAVDGCERMCMKHLLERLGRSPEFYLSLTDVGLQQQEAATLPPGRAETRKRRHPGWCNQDYCNISRVPRRVLLLTTTAPPLLLPRTSLARIPTTSLRLQPAAGRRDFATSES